MSNDPKVLLAAKFLDSFLREIVLDTAINTHASIKRARSICHLCGIRCQAHTPAAEQSASNGTLTSNLDASTPSRSATPVPGSSSTASHKPDYYSNNPLFECLVCSRQVSSNRYATHLAKCMGMGSKGGRKGAARNAKATTSSLPGSNRQSGAGTPRYASDADDDSFAKRKNGTAAGSKNGVKRGSSPLAASTLANARMNKRIKTSSPTPPPSDSLGMGMNRSYSSQPFAPSGLSNSTVLSGSLLNPNNASTPSNGKSGPPRVAQGRSTGGSKSNKPTPTNGTGGLQRERGSDGEFIDVESASEQSDADSF
ncbi:hypothetical protein [Sporisorium scitamineum]|uniref:SAGA-associated factor 11 n=1 Tax=Sporisorium scitamineum TaxID=49012 RepID=A0A0F7SAT3_9BASI|nr:hypothetical protein [Sporisorium scitamineum]